MADEPIDFDDDLPADVKAGLKSLYGRPVEVPQRVDRLILSAARVRLMRQRRVATVTRWSAAVAAAAMVLLGIRVALFHPPAASRVARAGDVNGDGQINIVDAYVVARALARHETLDPAWDVNHDGVVDDKDVDAIARQAVRVSGGAQ